MQILNLTNLGQKTDFSNSYPLDFIKPIKMLIKKKTQDMITDMKEINIKGCLKIIKFKENLNKSDKDSDKNYNGKCPVINKRKIKKVSFRNTKRDNLPMTEVFFVKSYKKDNYKNNFKGVHNKNDKSEETSCQCKIF